MSQTIHIAAAHLGALALHQGDTLRVLSNDDAGVVVVIERLPQNAPLARKGTAREWVRSAKGSVHLSPGASIDEARMEYYAGKYGLK